MLKFHSTQEPGILEARAFFPNKKGVSILRTKSIGEPDVYEVTTLLGTPNQYDLLPSTTVMTDEIGYTELVEKIRIESPD